MKRNTKGSVLDISIRGDELEHHRIQLENNLQHTDLSLRLSSASDNEGFDEDDSIEYPRHNSGPSTFPDFASFEHRSRDHFDGDTHSQIHPWSYHTVDDEEGINPYAGETMSTAAHHASALTLNAGLGGGRGARRDISLSGAEYDPDRPLHDMIAGVDSRLSVFDIEASRSKYPGIGSVTYDPLVVDSTAELDRVLQSGYAPPIGSQPQNLHSPLHSSSSSSASDSDHNPSSRPKLSDALRRVSFSPKRPRSAQSNRSDSRHHHPAPSPLAHTSPLPNTNTSYNAPTPRPAKRTNIFPSYPASPVIQQPQVRLQPPTPTSTSSKFSRMARGLAREIEEQQQEHADRSRPASAPVGDRNPFDTTSTSLRHPTPRRASAMKQQTPRGKVHLPDVTGLTSAVESPAKLGSEYYPYRASDGPRESEARLLKTLSAVQVQLHHLEHENSISRRRVRELELELEVCKRDVVRERTRVMEREEVIVQQQRDVSDIALSKKNKGKARAKDVTMNEDAVHEKYREAVEEKKALEALISTLRTHLTRLTSELSSHQELLTELRTLRDSDARALKQKSAEVDRLKEEVERLAGEVEVLRGVVEEGLKERRAVRDVSIVHSTADLAMSEDMDLEEEEEEDELETEAQHEQSRRQADHEDNEHQDTDTGTEDNEEPEPFDPVSILGSSRDNAGHVADRTMRTDHATLGSSKFGTTASAGQFIDSAEFERISAEVEERRSERSRSQSQLQAQLHSRSPSPVERRSRRATVEDVSDREDRPASPAPSTLSSRRSHQRAAAPPPAPRPSSSRPAAPIAAQPPSRHSRRQKPQEPMPVEETPFPQIRGTQLERLFFSAPEHNAKTCTVCHRRRREPEASWIPSRFGGRGEQEEEEEEHDHDEEDEEEEDEGFAEGSEGLEHEQALRDRRGKHHDHVTFSHEPGPWRQQARKEGLPPQTVVACVIRELEDDFTHYKSIYVELADQYGEMDAVSDVRKRNTLAQHLREVVDILEQKGDQIASLYDLLSFKDKPVSESIVPSKTRPPPATTSSWGRSGGLRRHGTALT